LVAAGPLKKFIFPKVLRKGPSHPPDIGGRWAGTSGAPTHIMGIKTEKEVLPVRLKTPAQPLVFCFQDATRLCAGVQALYGRYPGLAGRLCLNRGRYYLAVRARLSDREGVRRAAGGCCLGAAPVLYAFLLEHGVKISENAVQELGRALQR